MPRKPISILALLFSAFVLTNCTATSQTISPSHEANQLTIPIGGNSWLINSNDKDEKITKEGFISLKNAGTICRTYVRVAQAGK